MLAGFDPVSVGHSISRKARRNSIQRDRQTRRQSTAEWGLGKGARLPETELAAPHLEGAAAGNWLKLGRIPASVTLDRRQSSLT